MVKEKGNKKKVNIIALIVILLVVYLVGSFIYYLATLPIKNIYIKGNNYLSDAEIIETAKIKNYPPLLRVSRSGVKKRLKKNNYIDDVKIKKKLNGTIIITISESKPVFYNRSTNKIVLLNKKEVDNNLDIRIPSLINIVPNDLYDAFVSSLSKVDYDVILQISEIEYSPDIINGKIIDQERFLLRMIDGNSVYTNPVNIKRLNNYFKAYDKLPDGVKGIFYFDSNSDNNMFKMYGAKEVSEVAASEE